MVVIVIAVILTILIIFLGFFFVYKLSKYLNEKSQEKFKHLINSITIISGFALTVTIFYYIFSFLIEILPEWEFSLDYILDTLTQEPYISSLLWIGVALYIIICIVITIVKEDPANDLVMKNFDELNKLTDDDLRKIAKKVDLPRYSKKKRTTLIIELSQVENVITLCEVYNKESKPNK